MKRVGDIVRKSAVLKIGSGITRITNLLSQPNGGDGVARRVTMRPEHRQVRIDVRDAVAHHQESSLDLVYCGYWCWVTEFVHVRDV